MRPAYVMQVCELMAQQLHASHAALVQADGDLGRRRREEAVAPGDCLPSIRDILFTGGQMLREGFAVQRLDNNPVTLPCATTERGNQLQAATVPQRQLPTRTRTELALWVREASPRCAARQATVSDDRIAKTTAATRAPVGTRGPSLSPTPPSDADP